MMYRPFLLLALFLLHSPIAHAEEIPPLEEWYHIESTWEFTVKGPMAYLPNFDTANGGYHATVMPVIRNTGGSAEVWYHRYKEDTESQFNMPVVTANLSQVDLDGNGVLDYIAFGYLVRGKKNGYPPEDSIFTSYNWVSTSGAYTIVDLNNDGIDDVLANLNPAGGGILFSVLVGGPDLKNLNYTLVPRRNGKEAFISLLPDRREDGTWRLVSWRHDLDWNDKPLWTSLILNEMTTWMQGDSLHISLRTLDSISLDSRVSGWEYGYRQSGLYRLNHTDKEYLFTTEFYQGNNGHVVAFEMENDRFNQIARFSTNNRSLHILEADINGDGYWDWATRSGDVLYFYAGQREGVDTVPLGRYQLPCGEGIEHLHVIGDVNNDGIRDMAVAIQPYSGVDGCFAIILGAPLRTVDVPEPVAGYNTRTFDMQQNYPNPVRSERTAFLPVTIEKLQHLTLELYSLQGGFIGTLYRGYLPEGSHTLPLELSHYELPRGMYLLRLTGEDGTRERAILLD